MPGTYLYLRRVVRKTIIGSSACASGGDKTIYNALSAEKIAHVQAITAIRFVYYSNVDKRTGGTYVRVRIIICYIIV